MLLESEQSDESGRYLFAEQARVWRND